MRGLDLTAFADQQKLEWAVQIPDPLKPQRRVFVGVRPGDWRTYRIRPENLDCRLGGGRHEYEDRGRDFANHGEAGIVEVSVKVCARCGRDKR
jgi:hypothetical protein